MNDLQIFSNPEFGQVRTVELGSRIDQLRIVAWCFRISKPTSTTCSAIPCC